MKLTKIIFSIFIFSTVSSCSLTDSSDTHREKEFDSIFKLKNEIEEIANSSICNEESECKFVAFGSKPCGGPWSYLVYSTSINEVLLLQKVTQLNTLENKYNITYGIISDCSAPAPPTNLKCVDGKCQAIYN